MWSCSTWSCLVNLLVVLPSVFDTTSIYKPQNHSPSGPKIEITRRQRHAPASNRRRLTSSVSGIGSPRFHSTQGDGSCLTKSPPKRSSWDWSVGRWCPMSPVYRSCGKRPPGKRIVCLLSTQYNIKLFRPRWIPGLRYAVQVTSSVPL